MEERVEDYIKRIEIIIETLSDHIEFEDYDEDVLKETSKDKEALENLLKRYKELEEENDDLKNDLYQDGLSHKYLTLRATSIPTSVIQNTLDDTNKNIEEFTKNVVTTKEEIEQEYWKSELNKAIAKRNVLQEILEEGRK